MSGKAARLRHGLARVFLALSLLAPALAGADRVVAVGDIHGAYEQFVQILQTAGIIDKDLTWIGGKTILVQTGDILDRGPQSHEALNLIMDLTEKAPQQGGEVRPLLGNHEVMVMMGDLRYVSEPEYRSFAGPDSEKIREREYESYLKYMKQRTSRSRKQASPFGEAEKKAWMDAHPLGFFEFRQAYSPNGKYGKWLRARDTVTQVDDTIFLHGGLSPELRAKNLKEINDKVRRELEMMDSIWNKLVARGVLWQYQKLEGAQAEAKAEYQMQQASGGADADLTTFLSLGNLNITSPAGPLWYRGYAQDSEAELSPGLDQVLKRFKARHLVLGHTIPTTKRITARFDGRVFLIDTGMLAAYFQGRPSALEIQAGNFKSIYVGERPQSFAANGGGKGQ